GRSAWRREPQHGGRPVVHLGHAAEGIDAGDRAGTPSGRAGAVVANQKSVVAGFLTRGTRYAPST
ncbi:MAG TPA: hypothetical protein VJT31_36500, partial [Rugosimonospora sp.]|nr:hypothetical protein [Rugosimonospora sp.]